MHAGGGWGRITLEVAPHPRRKKKEELKRFPQKEKKPVLEKGKAEGGKKKLY